MKRGSILLMTMVSFMVVLGLYGSALADLIELGTGTFTTGGISYTEKLIYDDVLDITWLDFTKSNAFWDEQMSWAENLEVVFDGQTFYDWRLPKTMPVNGSTYFTHPRYDGSSDAGYNISAPGSAYPGSKGSEMAHLHYTTLGNLGFYDLSGNDSQPGYGLQNSGPFTNLLAEDYWSSTEYPTRPTSAWDFDFDYGRQSEVGKTGDPYVFALAVHDGDIAVIPVPGAVLLGVLGLSVAGWKLRRRKE